jgi:hypothetical protein
VPLGGRGFESEGEPLIDGNVLDGEIEDRQSEILDLEPEGTEEVIIGAPRLHISQPQILPKSQIQKDQTWFGSEN